MIEHLGHACAVVLCILVFSIFAGFAVIVVSAVWMAVAEMFTKGVG